VLNHYILFTSEICWYFYKYLSFNIT